MTDKELAARVAAITPWHHSIDLGRGVVTPGGAPHDFFREQADIIFAAGVTGHSVLDVGAWDGFFSFEAERRGASRVLAADWYCWGGPGPGKREAFQLAREVLASSVEDRLIDIPQTTVETVGQFDIVLFNGIVYHILNPLSALEQMARIARYLLTVETHLDLLDLPRPAMIFYPGEPPVPGQPQNGWGPNSLCMHALLKRLGFQDVLEFATPRFPGRSIFLAFQNGHPFEQFVADHRQDAKPRFGTTA